MSAAAYYNEIDAQKAAWLRELMSRGLIARGDVDERSIAAVCGADLRGYRQCHFFAGIGVWSYALRLAGWRDDRPVWTGSCPCQPFSAAGKRKGTADDRHLWPELARLVAECCPDVFIGEQVAGEAGRAWFDLVRSDLERLAYACGASDTPAASVGAPHIRQRLYWVGLAYATIAGRKAERREEKLEGVHADSGGSPHVLEHATGDGREQWGAAPSGRSASGGRGAHWVAQPSGDGLAQRRGDRGSDELAAPERVGATRWMGDSDRERLEVWLQRNSEPARGSATERVDADRSIEALDPWAGARWVLTRPQRVGDSPGLRPVEPGTFPLADGIAERVGLLRGYGDAIVAPHAAAWIQCVMEEIDQYARTTKTASY